MGYNKTPLTAFSDGRDAITLFGLIDPVRCRRRRGRPSCRPYETDVQPAGRCLHAGDPGIRHPLRPGQRRGLHHRPALRGHRDRHLHRSGQLAERRHFREPGRGGRLPYPRRHPGRRRGRPTTAMPARSPPTSSSTSRRVPCAASRAAAAATTTRPGTAPSSSGAAPGYDVQPGRQAHMYLIVHRLPIRRNAAGGLQLRPRYFAGVRPGSGEPLWTRHESRAKPLAMDGVVGGQPGRRSAVPEPDGRELARAARQQVDDAVRRRRLSVA